MKGLVLENQESFNLVRATFDRNLNWHKPLQCVQSLCLVWSTVLTFGELPLQQRFTYQFPIRKNLFLFIEEQVTLSFPSIFSQILFPGIFVSNFNSSNTRKINKDFRPFTVQLQKPKIQVVSLISSQSSGTDSFRPELLRAKAPL